VLRDRVGNSRPIRRDRSRFLVQLAGPRANEIRARNCRRWYACRAIPLLPMDRSGTWGRSNILPACRTRTVILVDGDWVIPPRQEIPLRKFHRWDARFASQCYPTKMDVANGGCRGFLDSIATTMEVCRSIPGIMRETGMTYQPLNARRAMIRIVPSADLCVRHGWMVLCA
jgi:hypothetical protein